MPCRLDGSGSYASAAIATLLLVTLAGCCPSESKSPPAAEVFKPFSLEDDVAAADKGARAIATSNQVNFPVTSINDGTGAPWGAAEGQNDVYAAVVLPAPRGILEYRIWLFSPDQPPRPHLRDIRVVTADAEDPGGPAWRVVRSRLSKSQPFTEKVTVPPLGDAAIVGLELDRTDPNWGQHKIWGIACFSASRGDARNYLPVGTGVYIRELQMK